ncbi:MAG: P-loop NTPase [Verrucomicrobia bacterium]|nr:P-loop NTPase [Verrucomicrobiota bacterium]
MNRETEVLNALRVIIDPDLGRDIVSLGFVKELKGLDDGRVAFTLELTTPACPIKEQFRTQCVEALKKLPWVKSVDVKLSAAARPHAPATAAGDGLRGVDTILAVSSCKGGVGKSTVAVNLAYTLAGLGSRVGLFDADIFGPSLPTMVSPTETEVYARDNRIQPLVYDGVKLMSFGYASPQGGPAIMRGPMVSQVLDQLLTQTEWGELDHLVIDMPPGTGDVQLTLMQRVKISAAVIVTTPQKLSFVDVVKGIQMFDKLKVPVVAVVENMSWFDCPGCGTRHRPFGSGARERLVHQFGIRTAIDLPIREEISAWSDGGRPVVLAEPDGPAAAAFRDLGAAVVREVSRLRHGAATPPAVTYEPGRGILVAPTDGAASVVSPALLRRACACALCIDERTGEKTLDPATVPESVVPTRIEPMGNYAVAIHWSDGHTSSIYPYDTLSALAERA